MHALRFMLDEDAAKWAYAPGAGLIGSYFIGIGAGVTACA